MLTAEQILHTYVPNREYPSFYHEHQVINAMEKFADQFKHLDESPIEGREAYEAYLKRDAGRNEYQLTNIPDQFGIKREWLQLWEQIEIWYGDLNKRESGKEFLERMQNIFQLLPAAPPSSAEGEVKEKDIEEFAEMMFNAGREFMRARNEFLYDDFEHWKEGGGYHLNGSFKWSNVVPSLLPASAPTPQEGRQEAEEGVQGEKPRCEYELAVIEYFGLPTDVSFNKMPKLIYADLVDLLCFYDQKKSAPLPTPTKGRQLYEVVPEEDHPHFGTRPDHWLYVPYLDNWLRPASTRATEGDTVIEALKEIKELLSGEPSEENVTNAFIVARIALGKTRSEAREEKGEAQDTEGQKGGGC